MADLIKTLPPNTKGRDFVIGDLHGSFSVLMNLLTEIQFDTEVDRLISVGDLVDRGPESLQCLRLLNEPWFHGILANHEQMMLAAFAGEPLGYFWLRNGGVWGIEALNDWQQKGNRVPADESVELWDLLQKVQDLPTLITIERPDGKKFHVIHAELPPYEKITDADLADPEKFAEIVAYQDSDGDYVTWGRYFFRAFYKSDVSNVDKVQRTLVYLCGPDFDKTLFNDELSHIISGHTILQRPMTIMGQTNIDTCAYGSLKGQDAKAWNALTCIDLDTWTFIQATETEIRLIEPLVVNSESIAEMRRNPDGA